MRASRPVSGLAWALCGVTVLAAAVQFPLRLPHLAALAARYDPFPTFPIITVATLAAAAVGAAIVSRHPRNPVGWLFCVTNCLAEVGLACQAYAQLSWLRGDAFPGASYAAWFEGLTGPDLALGSLTFLLLLFPTGRLPSPRWRPVAWLTGLALLYLQVLLVGFVGRPGDAVPAQDIVVDGLPRVQFLAGEMVLFASLFAAVASVVLRRRRATGIERQQLRLMAVAATALAGSVLLLLLAGPLGELGVPEVVLETLFYLAYGGLPVAAGLAILRYRLYDIDLILNRAVVFAVLGAISTVGYVVVVVSLGSVLGNRVGSGVTVSLVATALVALAVQPARQRARRLANRVVYGERAAPYEVLATLAQRLGETLSVDEVLPRVAAAAAQGVGARAAVVRLHLPDGESRTARWPDGPAEGSRDVSVPVLHAGDTVGEITVELRPGVPLDHAGRELLTGLAGQAGLALHDVRLTYELRRRLLELSARSEELAASRQRLLVAQAVERQRFERRITDEVHPHLAALRAGIPQVEQMLGRPEAAGEAVVRLSEEAAAALDALRDIARGVFPPLLVDRGLLPALRAAARASRAAVTITAEGTVPRYPVAVEATAYFCVTRCLAEAVERGAPVGVTLRPGAERLDVLLTGPPLPPDLQDAISDRASGTGGTVVLGPDGTGTLHVQLPAAAVPPEVVPASA